MKNIPTWVGKNQTKITPKNKIMGVAMVEENQTERAIDVETLSESDSEMADAPLTSSGEKSSSESQSLSSQKSLRAPTPLSKILILAILAGIFVISIVLNFTLLIMPETPEAQTDSRLFLVVIVASLLVTSLSIGVSFWLYYVRSILLKDGPALVPEKWGLILQDLTSTTALSKQQIVETMSSVYQSSLKQFENSESLLKSFLTLQEAVSLRDKEIERLKEGHDTKVFKRFLMRFVRVSRAIREIHDESSGTSQEKDYKYLLRLIEDALEECGVEIYMPTLGLDYREVGPEIADNPKTIAAVDPHKDYAIAAVDSPGYVIEGEGGVQVIVPAKVSIYRVEQSQQGDN